jgi:hypothetical protein
MLVALSVTLQLTFEQPLVCALTGFAIIKALKYTIGRPVVALQRWLEGMIAGTKSPSQVVSEWNTVGNKGGGAR